MAREATGTTSYSQNPTSTGAVYFTEAPDLLTAHYKNLQMFDEGQQRKRKEEAAKQEVAAKMFNDLKLDSEGILDRDVPFFQDRIKKANDFLVEGYKAGYDPTKAGAGAFYNTYKKMLDETQLLMNRSKSDRLAAVEATKQGVEKGDPKLTADRVYEWASRPITERATGDWSKLFVGKQADLLNLTKEKVMKDIPLSSTSEVVKEPQTGGFVTEKISTYSPTQISGMAKAGYRGNTEIAERVNDMYSQLDPNKQQSLTSRAKAQSKGGEIVSPQQLFYEEYINSLNAKEQEKSGVQFTPAQRAYWNDYYGNSDEEEYVKYIAEAVGKANSDDKEFWGEGVDSGEVTPVQPVTGAVKSAFGVDVGIPTGKKTYYSNALNNLPLGNAAIPVTKKDASGNEYTTYASIPNRVLGLKKEDGKVFIQTDESIELNRNGETASDWEEVNDRTVDKLVLGSKNPIKAAGLLRKTLINMGAYKDKNVKFEEKKAPKGQLTKTLSSGRKVYSDDNGKTWHP